jgi:hypothetical protein
MLLDLNLIVPIRETNTEPGAKRRRQERDKTRRVQSPREGDDPPPPGDPGRPKGKALNAYV